MVSKHYGVDHTDQNHVLRPNTIMSNTDKRERLIAMNNIFHEYESLQQEYPEVYNESKEHGMTILGD